VCENCLIDDTTKEILQKLSDGDFTFAEACNKLGISEKELEDLFEKFTPTVSIETMRRLCASEKETMAYIREMADKNRPPVIIGNCERSCEYCTCVDHGCDETSHLVYWITPRCPLYEQSESYRKITGEAMDIQSITRFTGCIYFIRDEIYKKQMEEADEQIRQLHERLKVKNEAVAKH
jgi:hypothetical protein